MSEEDIKELLYLYWNTKQPVDVMRNSEEIETIQETCKLLWETDYQITQTNIPSLLCSSYPKTVYTPISKNGCDECTASLDNKTVPSDQLFDCFAASSNGRARGRFIAPTILLHIPQTDESRNTPHTRYIFRSGALIQPPEALLRSMKGTEKISGNKGTALKNLRKEDQSSMIQLGVGFVFDLMVEEKLTKFLGLLKCVSSEKSSEHGNLYELFHVLSMPYPGYELFSRFNQFCKKLHLQIEKSEEESHHIHYEKAFCEVEYPWNKKCTTELSIHSYVNTYPSPATESLSMVPWAEYQTWKITDLTMYYMKVLISLLLSPIREEDKQIEKERLLPCGHGGILIHCISGWDRTPLFVSMLRLSLWADKVVHESLSATQMVYFTIAYDWLLFGHDLHTRASQNVELLYFCFLMLNAISGSDFSIHCLVNKRQSKSYLFLIFKSVIEFPS